MIVAFKFHSLDILCGSLCILAVVVSIILHSPKYLAVSRVCKPAIGTVSPIERLWVPQKRAPEISSILVRKVQSIGEGIPKFPLYGVSLLKQLIGWGCNSVVECLLSLYQPLSSIPSIANDVD